MITITSNLSEVMAANIAGLEFLGNTQLERTIAVSMLGVVKNRIHTQGIASDGSSIGTYSPGYMKVRTGIFSTNATLKRGKNKGETKSTGVYTKGKDKGKPRINYNRTADTKVVLSLTRQMETDFTVVDNGSEIGLGFHNAENYNKSQYCEATYKKPIYNLTAEELAQVTQITEDFVNAVFK